MSAPPALVLEQDGGGCDGNACPSACAPGAPIAGLAIDAAGRLTWTPSADACHATAGIGYRVYRATSARPLVQPAVLFPQDTAFSDRSVLDADGSLLDTGFTDTESPGSRGVFYYLVTDDVGRTVRAARWSTTGSKRSGASHDVGDQARSACPLVTRWNTPFLAGLPVRPFPSTWMSRNPDSAISSWSSGSVHSRQSYANALRIRVPSGNSKWIRQNVW